MTPDKAANKAAEAEAAASNVAAAGEAAANAGRPAGAVAAPSAEKKPALRKIADVLISLAQICGLLTMVVVAGLALFATGSYAFTEGDVYYEGADLLGITTFNGACACAAAVLCALIVLALLFCMFRTRLGACRPWKLTAAVIVWCLVFQGLWIASLNCEAFTFPDTVNLEIAANALLSGDISQFHATDVLTDKTGPDLYFTLYPFQAGSLYLFAGIFAIFGQSNIVAFQAVNAVANCLSVICLVWLTKSLSGQTRAINLTSLLCGLCFPLLFSCVLVYGNSIGLMGSCAALALLAHGLTRSETKARAGFTALSFLAITIAMLMKSTCILFLIAMVVLLLIESARTRSASLCALTIVCAIVAHQLSGIPTKALEAQTETDFGDGMPKTSWIAMGLRTDNPLGVPGWWGLYPSNLLFETNGDTAAQNAAAIESIESSLVSFVQHPSYGLDFISWKLESEWSDPTFQTLYYSSMCTAKDGLTHNYGRLASSVLYGNLNKPFLAFMDAFQILVVGGALAYSIRAVARIRKRRQGGENGGTNPIVTALLPSCIFLGFSVYLLWEAKAIYTLPFFMLMIPLAATQMNSLFEWLGKRMFKGE